MKAIKNFDYLEQMYLFFDENETKLTGYFMDNEGRKIDVIGFVNVSENGKKYIKVVRLDILMVLFCMQFFSLFL
jgi:hypothetical protein